MVDLPWSKWTIHWLYSIWTNKTGPPPCTYARRPWQCDHEQWNTRSPFKPFTSVEQRPFSQSWVVSQKGLPETSFYTRDNMKAPAFCLAGGWPGIARECLPGSWPRHLLLCLPSFPPLTRVLGKIWREGTDYLFITPLWSCQIWFSILIDLARGQYFHLPDNPDLPNSRCRCHHNVGHLQSKAWRLLAEV